MLHVAVYLLKSFKFVWVCRAHRSRFSVPSLRSQPCCGQEVRMSHLFASVCPFLHVIINFAELRFICRLLDQELLKSLSSDSCWDLAASRPPLEERATFRNPSPVGGAWAVHYDTGPVPEDLKLAGIWCSSPEMTRFTLTLFPRRSPRYQNWSRHISCPLLTGCSKVKTHFLSVHFGIGRKFWPLLKWETTGQSV